MIFKFNSSRKEYSVFYGEKQLGYIMATDIDYQRFYVEDMTGFWETGCTFLEAVNFLEVLI